MDGLLTALDELAAADLHALGGPGLLERTRALTTVINKAQAELARTVRAAETAQAAQVDGLKTMGSWLRGHCRYSPAAAQVVRNGRALQALPAVAAAHATGAVTAEQVAVIAQITTPEHAARAAAQNIDPAAIDAALAALATASTHADTARAVHHYLARLDPDGPEPDPTARRSLSYATLPDGTLTGRFTLDAVGGEKLRAAIECLLQAHRPAGDTRSQAQRHADALVQLCDNQLAAGTLPRLRTVKPHVGLVVGLHDLADPATGPAAAELGFGAVVSAAAARWIACDADLTRIVLDPDGVPARPGPPAPLQGPAPSVRGVGGSGALRFAGCQAPTWWCEVHHILEWIYGGRPTWRTPGCCARATTPRSTTASASTATPPGPGTPTAPPAPRSTSSGHPPRRRRDPRPRRLIDPQRRGAQPGGGASQGLTVSSDQHSFQRAALAS